MKKRLLLLLYLIPHLIFAESSFYLKEYNKIVGKISERWKWHEELFAQFNGFNTEEKEQHIGLVLEAIVHCQSSGILRSHSRRNWQKIP